jgi:hypothetical protein
MKFGRMYSGWVALMLLVLAVACGKEEPAKQSAQQASQSSGNAALEAHATKLAEQPTGSVNGLWGGFPQVTLDDGTVFDFRMGIEPRTLSLFVDCKAVSGKKISVEVNSPAEITANTITIASPVERSVTVDGATCRGEIKAGKFGYTVNGSDLTLTTDVGSRLLLSRIK